MEEERDVVVFSDDDGNEFELDVIEYFDYNGQEYAVLMDLSDLSEEEGCEHEEECDCNEHDVFIMKVVVKDDMEEFLPADDEDMEVLATIVEELLTDIEVIDEDGEEDGEADEAEKE